MLECLWQENPNIFMAPSTTFILLAQLQRQIFSFLDIWVIQRIGENTFKIFREALKEPECELDKMKYTRRGHLCETKVRCCPGWSVQNFRNNIVRPLLIKMLKLLGRSVYVDKVGCYWNASDASLLLRRWRIIQMGLFLCQIQVLRNELTLKKRFSMWTLDSGFRCVKHMVHACKW